MATVVECDPKAPFSLSPTLWCSGVGGTPFLGLLNFTLHQYLIMLNIKQVSIKQHFLSLSHDSTWDETLVIQFIWVCSLSLSIYIYIYVYIYVYIIHIYYIIYTQKTLYNIYIYIYIYNEKLDHL